MDTIPQERLVRVTLLVHSRDSEFWEELISHFRTLERQRHYQQQVLWNMYKLEGWSAYHATDLWGSCFFLSQCAESVIADLNRADIIVLGLSVDLLNLLQGIEHLYPTLIQKALDGSTNVFMVTLRATIIRDEGLKKAPTFPRGGEPMTSYRHRDGVYVEAASAIEQAIDQRVR